MPDRPTMQCNFVVNLGGGSDPTSFAGGFQEVTGLGTELAQQDYRVGNSPDNNVMKLTGLNKVADVTLKRGIINPTELFGWLNEVREGNPSARRSVTIEVRGLDLVPVARWTLSEARPVKWVLGALNAKGNDVAIEELVLASERVTVELA